MLAFLINLVLALAPSPNPADPHIEQVARILAPLTELRALNVYGPATFCPGDQEASLWLAIEQEQQTGLDCLLRSRVAPRCAVSTLPISKRDNPICPPKNGGTQPASDWIPRLAPLLLDEEKGVDIEPVKSGLGLHLTNRATDHYIMIRAATGWLLLPQSIGLSDLDDARNRLQIVETTQMTKTPSWGVIAAFYDAGTELGDADTELYIVVPQKDALRVLAHRTIGVYRWVLPQELLRQPFTRIPRSEVAVTLTPTFTADGLLQLRLVEKSLGRLSQFCSRKEIAGNRAIDSEICPLPLITQVRDAQGTWQLLGDKWVRATAAAPRRRSPGP